MMILILTIVQKISEQITYLDDIEKSAEKILLDQFLRLKNQLIKSIYALVFPLKK